MSRILSSEELEVGMHVTVLEHKALPPMPNPFASMFAIPLPGEDTKTEEVFKDRSFIGDVLTVLAIDHPFIVVRKESEYAHNTYKHTIDIRHTSIMALKEEFVRSSMPHLFKDKDDENKA